MPNRRASTELQASSLSPQELLRDGASTNVEEDFWLTPQAFLHDSGQMQRISVECLILALRRELAREGCLVGAVWHVGHRFIRVRAALPHRLRWRDSLHQELFFRLDLIERILPNLVVHGMSLKQFGPYLDLTAEVEAAP